MPGLKVTEEQFLGWISDTARTFGWTVWHVPLPARHLGDRVVPTAEGAGLPDLVLLHEDPPRMILAELKVPGGRVSEAQRVFLRMATAVADRGFRVDDEPETDGDGVSSFVFARAFAVYLWWQGRDEDFIEQTLRSKVLVAP